jgi:integrase
VRRLATGLCIPAPHMPRSDRALVVAAGGLAQEQLGHASISTTLNIYTHVVDASHRKAVEEVEERLFGEMDCSGLKLASGLAKGVPANDSVNSL